MSLICFPHTPYKIMKSQVTSSHRNRTQLAHDKSGGQNSCTDESPILAEKIPMLKGLGKGQNNSPKIRP